MRLVPRGAALAILLLAACNTGSPDQSATTPGETASSGRSSAVDTATGEVQRSDVGSTAAADDNGPHPGPCEVRVKRGQVVEWVRVYRYDEAGREVQRSELPVADPDARTLTLTTWDAAGRPAAEKTTNADGSVRLETTIRYSPQGEEVARVESSPDGHTEKTERTWESGRLVREVRTRADDDTTAGITTWRYDEQGRRTAREFDAGGDGVLDGVIRYVYDDAGRIIEESERDSEDVALRTTLSTWGPSGHKTREELRAGGPEGRVLERRVWTLDAQGRPLTMQLDQGGDGTVETTTTWTRDERGNLLSERVASGDDDPDARVTSSTYECWKQGE